jgi:hypothetical protein
MTSDALKPGDDLVIARIARSAAGASAVDIAKARLGPRARKHTIASLDLIGLGIAARLVGQGVIRPTRGNQFVIDRKHRTTKEESCI